MLNTPDEELARMAAGGRLECFEELLARYRDRVFRICLRSAGNAEDAEDWAQDCFVRAYRKLGYYDPSLPFAPWMFRLVSNTCINEAKARRRHQERQQPEADEDLVPDRPEMDPLHKLLVSEEEGRALKAIAALPPPLRVAVTLRVVEDLSFRELSEVLGVPLQTAATRVRRALQQVRKHIAEQECKASKSTQEVVNLS